MNSCCFVGRVFKKPEIKKTNTGKPFCKFWVKVSRYKDVKDYVPVQVWGELSEKCCKLLDAENLVKLVASYEPYSFEKEGEKKTVPQFTLKDIEFFSEQKEEEKIDIDDDQLPF